MIYKIPLRYLFVLLLFILFSFSLLPKVLGQSKGITVYDIGTGAEIPFAAYSITANGISIDSISSIQGLIQLPHTFKQGVVEVRHPHYRTIKQEIGSFDTVLQMVPYVIFPFKKQPENPLNRAEIDELYRQGKKLKPYRNGPFAAEAYSKIYLKANDIHALKGSINGALKILQLPLFNKSTYDHYFLLSELKAHYNYESNANQKQVLDNIIISGIDRPDLALPAMLLHAYSVYDNEIAINGSFYCNPLGKYAPLHYQYNLVDSIQVGDDTWRLIQFQPKRWILRNYLFGYFWYNTKHKGVMAAEFTPILSPTNDVRFLIQNTLDSKGRVFAKERLVAYNFKVGVFKLKAQSNTVYDYKALDTNEKYSEIIINYDSLNNKLNDTNYFNTTRKIPLDELEHNTYKFYAQQGNILKIQNYLNFAQRLYYGELPVGPLNLVLNQVLMVNNFEFIRPGIGLRTQPLLKDRLQLYGYVGYGIGDSRFKYRFESNFKTHLNSPLSYFYRYQNEVQEPGVTQFAFDKNMYGVEALRRLQLPQVDYFQQHHIGINYKLGRYIYTTAGAKSTVIQPNYDYTYINTQGETQAGTFPITELNFGLRISYGEHFMKLDKLSFSLGTQYPELWLQYSTGMNRMDNCNCTFNKIEGKINYKTTVFSSSVFGTQLRFGVANGELPYPLLFNMRGSLLDFSAITYNSFETMLFQEFVADRYVASFNSFSLPAFNMRSFPSAPRLVFMHNMGIGQFSSRERHTGIELKSLERGFFESGAFVSDILRFYISGGYLGTGIGLFQRYGPNRFKENYSNTVYKFSLTYSF